MGIELNINICNTSSSGYESPIRVTDNHPTISWVFDQVDRVSIDEYTGVISSESSYGQVRYEIRISTYSYGIGSNSFIGNKVQTGWVDSQDAFWTYSGSSLLRGVSYYGQIRVRDDADRTSDWGTFSFYYNSLPYVSSLTINPLKPSLEDSLQLSYSFYDADGDEESGTIVRWFRNGSYQKQHDNSFMVGSSYLQNNDIWYAEIYPSDGYEYGEKFSSPHVIVKKSTLIVSNVKILPIYPNNNDILRVDYTVDDATRNEGLSVRWYINGKLDPSLNDKIYIRPDVSEGDIVGVAVKTESDSTYYYSEDVAIQSSDFVVSDILIDGRTNPLDISTVTPSIKWKSYVPYGKTANYVSIKIGTFFNSDNVYSEVFNFNRDVFTVPSNTLQKGRDYFISISISDTQSFEKYSYSHFRTSGSRWESSVDNATGWTIETMFSVKSTSDDENSYQVIRIQDGSNFAEIQIRLSGISVVSASVQEYEYSLSGFNTLVIAGKNNDIKLYLNNNLVIDGEGLFTQQSNTKRLELGSMASDFEIHYKYFFYTVSGYHLPDVSSEFSSLQFYTWREFEESEVVALNSYLEGKKVFAVNPDNRNENSVIYSIISGSSIRYKTTARTFSPILKIRESPNSKNTVLAHSSGATLITGYAIGSYSHENLFIDSYGNISEIYPDQYGWEVIKDIPYDGVYIDSDGLHINTL